VDRENKQNFIRNKARENRQDSEGRKILWSRHGVAKLAAEGWRRTAIEQGLEAAELIEDYPTMHRVLPDCLVLAWLAAGDPFHAVIAVDEANDRLFVVTVYRPGLEAWQDDWRIRKR
jgi:hypothetical protein